MKIFLFFALIAFCCTSCGNKTKNSTEETDSAKVEEISDTLITVNTITDRVKAVYDYLTELRNHPDDTKPSVDERFATKEWQQTLNDVREVDSTCECGGYFDFGENGPLDAWVYDCHEGKVTADSIKVELRPNGTAEVRFFVKNSPGAQGVPMRWLMRMEDGEWRVADIIFEQNDGLDLLMGMRAYADDGKYNKTFDLNKYLPAMKQLAAKAYDSDEFYFDNYGLLDIDRDGIPEVTLQSLESNATVVYSIAGGKPTVLANSFAATEIYYFQHGVAAQGGCGTGCMMGDYTILENSLPKVKFRSVEEYDMNGDLDSSVNTIDDKEVTQEEIDKLLKTLGEQLEIAPVMHEIEE